MRASDVLRDLASMVTFELRESLRSRRILVLMVLYLGLSMGGTILFVEVLRAAETELARTLAVPVGARPGTLTRELMSSDVVHHSLIRWTRDRPLADSLLETPPLALFHGWLAMLFLPTLTVLTSVEAVAQDVATGSIRFLLLRVDRDVYALGKLVAHTLMLGLGIAVGSLVAFAIGWLRLASFEAGPTLEALARYSVSAWTYGFAWLSVSLCASQLSRSVPVARALALVFMLVLAAVAALPGLLGNFQRTRAWVWLAEAAVEVLPSAHRMDLFRPDWTDRIAPSIAIAAFGLFVFALGHLRLATRDL